MSTLLKQKILEVNSLTQEEFTLRPQNKFQSNRTCSYPKDDRVNELVAELGGFWKDCEWCDDDVALLSENSIIAIMAASLEMEEKSPLCELGIKWWEFEISKRSSHAFPRLLARKAPESEVACIVQSFYAKRIGFKQIYAIRVAIWNVMKIKISIFNFLIFQYITKPDLVARTILKFSKTGKLELHVRNHDEFDGNVVNEHIFLSGEYLKLTRDHTNPLEVCFRPMALYDYTIRQEGEYAEPISQRGAPLGYNPKKEANPECFRDYFVP